MPRTPSYRNTEIDLQPPSLAKVLRWRWQAHREGLPPPPSASTPRAVPDLAFLSANAGPSQQPAATWIGHSTVLLQAGGLNVLTDPIFSERASPLSFTGPQRHSQPGLSLGQLPHIDLVLVSHNHYDHLDLPSVRALTNQSGGSALFLVPLGLAAWFKGKGIDRVIELDWYQSHIFETDELPPVECMLVPAQHWSARGLADRFMTLWGGFALLADNCHAFFAGDTGYSRDFNDIRERLAPRQTAEQGGGFDIALLPIGAYAPRWFMAPQHVDVPQALQIHDDLAAKRSLGIHWGTFQLTDEALDEPPRVLEQLRQQRGMDASAFFTLALGQTEKLAPRRKTNGT